MYKFDKVVSGWGLTNKVSIKIYRPENNLQIQDLISNIESRSLITRGLGRSYGDAAQLKDSFALDLKAFKEINLDIASQTVTVGAGVSFAELLKEIIPAGFFLPVSPGTKNVTVGGAIACDVHGKNHHIDGSFGNHVKEIEIIDGNSILHKLNSDSNDSLKNKFFWATIGGMGLTGVVVKAKFSLIPISSSFIKVDTKKFDNLKELMEAMIVADKKYRYSVAWVDILSKRGRGILTCGNHADKNELTLELKETPLSFEKKSLIKAPDFFPRGIINQFTIKLFNEAWFRKAPNEKINELQHIEQYFYPLDGINNWNNLYGPKGFLQYQFVIPDESSFLISEVIENFKKINASSFLTVLKRFGPSNKGMISFPKPGWTLAIDIPSGLPELYFTLDKLDDLIASHHGRIYLAKDSRMSQDIFRKTYENYQQWKEIKDYMDPRQVFFSDLSKRLSL